MAVTMTRISSAEGISKRPGRAARGAGRLHDRTQPCHAEPSEGRAEGSFEAILDDKRHSNPPMRLEIASETAKKALADITNGDI